MATFSTELPITTRTRLRHRTPRIHQRRGWPRWAARSFTGFAPKAARPRGGVHPWGGGGRGKERGREGEEEKGGRKGEGRGDGQEEERRRRRGGRRCGLRPVSRRGPWRACRGS